MENVGNNEVPDFVENTDDNPLLLTGGRGSSMGDVDGDELSRKAEEILHKM